MASELIFSQKHWRDMRHHVELTAPMEACGLLAGKDGYVVTVLPMTNIALSPVLFRMDPRQLLKSFDWIESQGLELVGIYHSHPAGPETPSPTDVAEAAYPVIQVILTRGQGDWEARGFSIEAKQITEVALQIVHSE